MRTATFYPTQHGSFGCLLTYEATMRAIERLEPDLRTTQMCMLDKVKDYDVIRIVSQYDVIEIVNNHDGTYSCDKTSRTLRRANKFFRLWENGEFDEREGA
jgi:hypothetical protein